MHTPILLDKTRNLRYGMVAMDKIEKKFKKPVAKIDFDNLTMEDAATIIWAGLVHEDSNLTVQKVMQLVDAHSSIKKALEVMGEAIQESFREDEVEKTKN